MLNGQRVTDNLADVIAHKTDSPRFMVLNQIRNSAFEHITEPYPKSGIELKFKLNLALQENDF
jgi:hypothetical protein